MCEYGFVEGDDYCAFLRDRADGKAGRPRTDHSLTIEMAKEICMIQRSEKGKQCRQYFIAVENQWNTPKAVIARALRMAENTLKGMQAQLSKLTVENQIMLPKAQYYDTFVNRENPTSFRDTAKLIGAGEKRFIALLLG